MSDVSAAQKDQLMSDLKRVLADAEALLLAERGGADPAKVREALRGGFAESRILEVHGQRMVEGDFTKLKPDPRRLRWAPLPVPKEETTFVEVCVDNLFNSRGDNT